MSLYRVIWIHNPLSILLLPQDFVAYFFKERLNYKLTSFIEPNLKLYVLKTISTDFQWKGGILQISSVA